MQQQFDPLTSKFFDNTMLSSYKECPTRYALRHQKFWRGTGTAAALIFGLSWHDSMDVVWTFAKKLDKAKLLDFAYLKFLETWEKNGLPTEPTFEEVEQMNPRVPGTARDMLFNYIETRWAMLQRCELLACEQPFAVPMPGLDNVWYIGRLDKVVRDQGQTLVIEHKTTTAYKKDGGFMTSYIESWATDSQTKGYQFAGKLYYPDLFQVWVDAALVHKLVHNAFRFVPVAHQWPLLQEWIEDTRDWIKRLEADKQSNNFPKNESQCWGKFGPCGFLNICRAVNRPITTLTETPVGFIEEKWEPFDVLKLDQLLQKSKEAK